MKSRYILIMIAAAVGIIVPAKMALDGSNSPIANAPIAKAEVGYEEEYPRAVTQDGQSAQDDPSTPEDESALEDRVFINNLGPNENTPASYIPPSYDPFNNVHTPEYDYSEEYPPSKQPNTLPEARLSVQPVDRRGFQYSDTVTTGTEMLFNASSSSDEETRSDKLLVRWDFESDGVPDTWFSTVRSSKHTYDKAGDYTATLEVLDRSGGVSKATKKIKVVNNTAPYANQVAKIKSGTPATVFEFDTSKSSDSQYTRQSLLYRFDWDSDGIYDTIYKSKTKWRHMFTEPGSRRVTMEVKDPEGLTATWYQDITVIANTAPTASFTVTEQKNGSLSFDASESADDETPAKKLQYRWDFNYTGADDIIFDTGFTTTPKHTGRYDLAGAKTVRLQVKDADGAISESFRVIVAE